MKSRATAVRMSLLGCLRRRLTSAKLVNVLHTAIGESPKMKAEEKKKLTSHSPACWRRPLACPC